MDGLGIERLSIEVGAGNRSSDDEYVDIDDIDTRTCARTVPYAATDNDSPIRVSAKAKARAQRRRIASSISSGSDGSGLAEHGGGGVSDPSSPRGGRTKRSRRNNACPFCKKLIVNFSRHLVLKHGDEEDVKRYVALESESPRKRKKQRAIITNKLRNLGNHDFNREIVEGMRHGEYLPTKHPTDKSRAVTNVTHVNCKYCFGLFRKDSFYKHAARCKGGRPRYIERDKKKALALPSAATLLVKQNDQASEMLRRDVFPRMQKDLESTIVQSDGLICKYGSNLRFTHRGQKQVTYCSNKMRSLARLLIEMRNLKPDIEGLRECLNPKNFNALVESVRTMSGFDPSCGESRSPSVPARLCSSLKKCANIVISDTIKDASIDRQQKSKRVCEMRDFLHLMDKDWASEVGTNSENTHKRLRAVKGVLLPEDEDIRTFCVYIKDLLPEYVAALEAIPNVKHYERLAKIVIGFIITMNRRRPNEVAEIPLEAYRSTLNQRIEYGQETETVITREEMESGKELSIFYAPSNKNLRKIPILLTKEYQEAVEVLIGSREKVGVKSTYLFGRPGERELFNGNVVLRDLANNAGLKNPSTFTANALRHHAATASQLHAEDDTFCKRLSRFMGHDIRTHEYFYEMPLPLVDKNVVGHRLLQMTKPSTSTTRGGTSQPSTSTAPDCPSRPSTSTAPDCPSRPSTSTASQHHPYLPSLRDIPESVEPPTSEVEPAVTPQRRTTAVRHWFQRPADVSGSDDAITPPKKKHSRKRWSSPEKNAIYQRFGHHFMMELKPTRSEIKALWETEECLRQRTLQQVVTYVNNIVNNKHTIPTPKREKIERMVNREDEMFSP